MSARPDILGVALRLGAKLRPFSGEYVGPCLRCGGRDRFSINVRKQLFNCRGCQVGGDVVDLLRHVRGASFVEAVEQLNGAPIKPPPALPFARAAAKAAAMRLWLESVDPRGTLAEQYLNSRALTLDHDAANYALRWHPRIGAMLALFRDVETSRPQAISRTFLDAEGRKLGRKFLGPVAGAAIMLDRIGIALHVGEGVETCMAARQLGLKPTWALGSAGAIAAVPVIDVVETLSTLQENDVARARACSHCAERGHAAGRDVFINTPRAGSKDLHDVIRSPS